MCQQLLTMASKPPIASSLNPNAPAFVPAAYLAAEDFSPEWWRLIQTCPSFRDYWLKERHTTEENEQQAAAAAEADEFDEIDDLLELGMMSIQLDEDETEEPSASFSFRGSPKQQQANERKPGAKYTSREYSSEHKYSPPEQYFPRFDGKGRTEVTNLDGNRHMVNARRGEFSGTSDLGKLDGTKYWSFVQPSHPTFPRGLSI